MELHEQPHRERILQQHRAQEGPRERALDLEEVLEVGAHAVDFAPAESRAEHEAVQRIARDGARQHGADRVAEPIGDRVEILLRRAERQHAQRRDHHGRPIRGCDAQLLRVDDANPEAVDERQQVGEQQRLAAEEDVERRDLAPLVAVVEVEREMRDARRRERFERDDAAHGVDRMRGDAQQFRKPVGVAIGERGALALAEV